MLDSALPEYDISDTVACVVDADADTSWSALMEVDLIELGKERRLVGILGGLRILPDVAAGLLRGKKPPPPPKRLRLRDMGDVQGPGGWVLLGERPGREIALGLVGRFWRPVIPYGELKADEFAQLSEPGWAKTVYSLGVTPIDESRTLLTGTMRTATTSPAARRWFRRYWTLGAGAGAHVLVNALLETARDRAQAAQ